MFTPMLNMLPRHQVSLWADLGQTPGHFVLYGGTALALRLGHRVSVDFDFFSNQAFNPDDVYRSLPFLENAQRIQSSANTLTCIVQRLGKPVKVSFFGDLKLGRVANPDRVRPPGITVASLLDLAATKFKVLQDRAESKDYLDMVGILETGLGLDRIAGAAMGVYGDTFNPMISLRALTFYEDGDLKGLEQPKRRTLTASVMAVDTTRLKKMAPLSPFLDR